MIEKIVAIKSIGPFRNFAATGDVTFRKLTLVYADNGRGKTTLCAILRSLRSGRPEFITERKTAAAVAPEFARLRCAGQNYQFSDNAWSDTYPDIRVFDPVFVTDNICSGDCVEHGHRKNLYRVIVGEQGVELTKKIEELDRTIREVNADIAVKRAEASRSLPPGTTLDSYLAWKPAADISERLTQKARGLDTQQAAAKKSTEIQTKGTFASLQMPSLPPDFVALLAKELPDVAAEAEARIRQQIVVHRMGYDGESWLSQGLGYVQDDRCPFCGTGLAPSELIRAYRAYFSAAYRQLKEDVGHLTDMVNAAIGEGALGAAQRTVAENAVLAEFWRQFIPVDLPDLPLSGISQRYAALRDKCLALARRKQANPAEPIALDPDFVAAREAVEALRTIALSYNGAINAARLGVENQKAAARSESTVTTLRRELAQLEALRKRFEPEVVKACDDYQKAVERKGGLDRDKAEARRELDVFCRAVLKKYEKSINDYLSQFNAGFRIVNTKHEYPGGTPRADYQIEINRTAIDLGDEKTPTGTPCFKTALSTGDRSALALAFFLAVLRQDSDLTEEVVVLDDPFCSLDRFRRTCTQQLIQTLCETAQQVVVLSHDPFFLKMLADGYGTATGGVKMLQMSRAGDGTVICDWDADTETQGLYMRDYATLLAFYRERRGDSYAVARSIRTFLEGLLRCHFPGRFQENEWLGEFIKRIREAAPGSGLDHAKTDLGELEAINHYSKKYHHRQNPSADAEPINQDELYGFVRRTLRLVGGC